MFFYIAMTEVIPEEFAQHSCNTKDKWLKYILSLLSVLSLSSSLALILSHPHFHMLLKSGLTYCFSP
jgi:hypothetical protein